MLQFPIPKLKKKNNKSKLNGGLASPLIFHFQLETKEYLFYSFYPLSYTIAEQYDIALLMVGANGHCSHIQSIAQIFLRGAITMNQANKRFIRFP